MADSAHTKVSAWSKVEADLTTLAQAVQERATRVTYLLEAMEDVLDNLEDLTCNDVDEGAKSRVDALNCAVVFRQMAGEAAQAAGDAGEKIEASITRLARSSELTLVEEKACG